MSKNLIKTLQKSNEDEEENFFIINFHTDFHENFPFRPSFSILRVKRRKFNNLLMKFSAQACMHSVSTRQKTFPHNFHCAKTFLTRNLLIPSNLLKS